MESWRPSLQGRSGPRYRAIASALAQDIESGRLAAGQRLPTHRELAFALGALAHYNSDTFGQVVSVDGNGNATILRSSPRIVTVPIILNTNGTTGWPNGKKNIVIVGFAQFFISSYDSKTVTGTFIRTVSAGTAGDGSGAWTPSASGDTTVALTG